MKLLTPLLCIGLLLSSVAAMGAEEQAAKTSFQKVQIDPVFRAEGVAVADFDGDGHKDIAAGSVYYSAPDWKMHSILAEPKAFTPDVYSDVFACYADDINGDGRPDVVTSNKKGVYYFQQVRRK